MDMPVVDEKSSACKHESNQGLNPFGQGFGDDIVATGLLSAHRFGVLTVSHFAASAGVTYRYLNDDIKNRLIGHKLVSPVKILRHERRAGPPPVLLSVAKLGYEHLCDAIRDYWQVERPEGVIGDYSPPPSCMDWKGKRAHRLALVDMLIAIEKSARLYGGCGVRDIIPEYRQWRGLAKPTSITLSTNSSFQADAVLALHDNSFTWPQMIELDLGTETISSQNPARLADTIEGKAKLYWNYLSSKRFMQRFDVNADAFQVLFITTSNTRIDNMRAVIGDGGLLPFEGLTPNDVFFFSTIEEAKADFFGAHWRTLTGRRCRIVEAS